MKSAQIVPALLSIALNATPTWAQVAGADSPERQQLIDRAMEARRSGDHAAAFESSRRAGAMRMTPTLRQFITEELQALGRYPEALENARLCLNDVEIYTTALRRDEVRQSCNRLVQELQTRVGTASATQPSAPVGPTAQQPGVAPPASGPGVGPWVVGGVGVAMLGGALATFIVEGGLRNEQHGLCADNDTTMTRSCTSQRGLDIDGERSTLRAVNYVLFFGGIAAVAGAVTWYVVERFGTSPRLAAGWNLHVSPSATGVIVGLGGAL